MHTLELSKPRQHVSVNKNQPARAAFWCPVSPISSTCSQFLLWPTSWRAPVLFSSAHIWVEQHWEDSYTMPTESGTIKFVQTATIKSWYGDSLRYAKRSRVAPS